MNYSNLILKENITDQAARVTQGGSNWNKGPSYPLLTCCALCGLFVFQGYHTKVFWVLLEIQKHHRSQSWTPASSIMYILKHENQNKPQKRRHKQTWMLTERSQIMVRSLFLWGNGGWNTQRDFHAHTSRFITLQTLCRPLSLLPVHHRAKRRFQRRGDLSRLIVHCINQRDSSDGIWISDQA